MGRAKVRLVACLLLLAMVVLVVAADNNEGNSNNNNNDNNNNDNDNNDNNDNDNDNNDNNDKDHNSPPEEDGKDHSPPPPESEGKGHHPPPPPKGGNPPPPPEDGGKGHHTPPPPKGGNPPPPPEDEGKGHHPPPPPKNVQSPPPPPQKVQSPPPPPPEKVGNPPPPPQQEVGNPPPPPPEKVQNNPPPPQQEGGNPPPSPPPPQQESGNPPPSPPPPPQNEKKAKCKDKKYKSCYDQEFSCPSNCQGGDCVVDCESCKPVCKCDMPGAVCQDPRFIGGDGITFYFHGKKDHDFCLISDSNVHINAHFIGRRNQDMHRDFTWVQSLGVLFDSHRFYVGALKTSTWDQSVDRLALTFDGESIFLPQSEGATWKSTTTPAVSITRTRYTNSITVEVEGNFKITATVVPITEEESRVHNYGITKDDCFAHLELGFKFYALSEDVHGVLGQTYRNGYTSRVKISAAMPVMGGVREFSSSNLFSTDCSVSRFHHGGLPIMGAASEYDDIECRSGVSGRGIVCKK
ncbi:uncharacterized protein LOC122092649 [Macadamia integrifolia]|uniref:uncharacterized protein LOC122092649 n=1 Tax=Macadamia integrifolia TaxID=60698 RepID=UPI001C532496|nr:uncharacterized protein LOC122092649 [Macadamia integrifolia]